jgi:hypothetical protein
MGGKNPPTGSPGLLLGQSFLKIDKGIGVITHAIKEGEGAQVSCAFLFPAVSIDQNSFHHIIDRPLEERN